MSVKLPIQFTEEYRPDLIHRAFIAQRSLSLQPHGNYLLAGFQNTAKYYGRRAAFRQIINTGRSRLPREKIPKGRSGRVMRVPHAMGGHRAHPPKAIKRLIERINLKEKNKAIRSAISATTNAGLIKLRNHAFSKPVPIIVPNSFEQIKRVKDLVLELEKLGLSEDLNRAKEGRKKRSGKSRLRKGGYIVPKSVLIVAGEDKGIWKACRNIPGIDFAKVDQLNVELLAPGGQAGRLTVWTEDALAKMESQQLYM